MVASFGSRSLVIVGYRVLYEDRFVYGKINEVSRQLESQSTN